MKNKELIDSQKPTAKSQQPSNVLMIGIMGGSASGKTTLAKKLAKRFDKFSPILLHQDHYFRDWSEYSREEREKIRTSNHPDGVRWEKLIGDLKCLKKCESIAAVKNESEKIDPSSFVILEGHLIFWNETVRDLMDIKIFLDVDPHERVLRRLERDVIDRGQDLAWNIAWYRRDVIPNFPTYTDACRKFANLIIPFEGENGVAVDLLTAGIAVRLDQSSEDVES